MASRLTLVCLATSLVARANLFVDEAWPADVCCNRSEIAAGRTLCPESAAEGSIVDGVYAVSQLLDERSWAARYGPLNVLRTLTLASKFQSEAAESAEKCLAVCATEWTCRASVLTNVSSTERRCFLYTEMPANATTKAVASTEAAASTSSVIDRREMKLWRSNGPFRRWCRRLTAFACRRGANGRARRPCHISREIRPPRCRRRTAGGGRSSSAP